MTRELTTESDLTKKKGILERLADGPVLGDGGYLLELEKRGWVRAGPFTPEVALTRPEALRDLHVEFREAGADVLQALTFYASRDKLATVGLENRLEELNRAAVRIAREVAGDRCLVAGNLSLTWMYEHGSPSSYDRVRQDLRRAARGPGRGGNRLRHRRDLLVAGRGAPRGRAREEDGPADDGHRLLREQAGDLGRPIAGRLREGAAATPGADIVGINCLRGPEHTLALDRGDAPGRGRLRGLPAGRLSDAGGEAGLHQPSGVSVRARPAAADAPRDGALGRSRRGTWASTTSAPAAARSRSTSGRWRASSGRSPRTSGPWTIDYTKPMSAYEYYEHKGK